MDARRILTADRIKELLRLVPLDREGGFFAETYRCERRLESGADEGSRSLATAIYYLLTPVSFSALHRLASDEVYHFYLGEPVELLLLKPGGGGRVVFLGTDLEAGQRPQAVVPAGAWQGARLAGSGGWALLGTTVSPGFDPRDFELGDRKALARSHPAFAEQIAALTR
jgi:predicted cupin superfamily sugar epimerase